MASVIRKTCHNCHFVNGPIRRLNAQEREPNYCGYCAARLPMNPVLRHKIQNTIGRLVLLCEDMVYASEPEEAPRLAGYCKSIAILTRLIS